MQQGAGQTLTQTLSCLSCRWRFPGVLVSMDLHHDKLMAIGVHYHVGCVGRRGVWVRSKNPSIRAPAAMHLSD